MNANTRFMSLLAVLVLSVSAVGLVGLYERIFEVSREEAFESLEDEAETLYCFRFDTGLISSCYTQDPPLYPLMDMYATADLWRRETEELFGEPVDHWMWFRVFEGDKEPTLIDWSTFVKDHVGLPIRRRSIVNNDQYAVPFSDAQTR